jgi:hypothetical protein
MINGEVTEKITNLRDLQCKAEMLQSALVKLSDQNNSDEFRVESESSRVHLRIGAGDAGARARLRYLLQTELDMVEGDLLGQAKLLLEILQ